MEVGTVVKKKYKELGVKEDATTKEIEAAYRKKAMQHHPDRSNGDSKKFKAVTDAYKILIDPVKRKRYDEAGDAGYKEESARSIESVVLHFFTEALNFLLETQSPAEQFDLMSAVSLCIEKVERELLKAEREGLKRLASLKKVDKRLKAKGPSIFLKQSLQHNIKEIQSKCDQARTQLSELKEAKELLKDYEYDFDKMPNPKYGRSPIQFHPVHFQMNYTSEEIESMKSAFRGNSPQ